MVLGGAFLFTLVAVEPHTTNSGIPTSETFSSYFRELRDAPHVLRTAVVPVAATGTRCCSPSSRSGSPARSRSGRAAASTRHSARSDRASSLFVSIAALGDGRLGAAHDRVRVRGGAVSARVARDGDDRTPELVPPPRPGTGHGSCRAACSPPSRSRRRRGGRTAPARVTQHAVVRLPLARRRRRRRTPEGDDAHRQHPGQAARGSGARGVHRRHRRRAAVYWRVIALDKYDGKLWTLEDSGEPAKDSRRRPNRSSATSWCRSTTSATRNRTGCRPRTTRSRSTSRTRSSSRTRRRCTSSPTTRSATCATR